jgi:hypothetical protein
VRIKAANISAQLGDRNRNAICIIYNYKPKKRSWSVGYIHVGVHYRKPYLTDKIKDMQNLY